MNQDEKKELDSAYGTGAILLCLTWMLSVVLSGMLGYLIGAHR